MRFILAFIVAFHLGFGAIHATMAWDVRSGGSDTNGGGFDSGVAAPGTDFSMQNSAQVTYTDLVIGATTTQLTSTGHPFGSTHPGNVIHIASGTGCTVGWFEVVSVSGTTATMDRSVGTAASTCAGSLGGSLATPAQAVTNSVTLNQIFIQGSASYSSTTALTINLGLNTALRISGYGTTHNDGGARPTLTTATNSVHTIAIGQNMTVYLDNLIISSTAGTPGDNIHNNSNWFFLSISNSKISGGAVCVNWGAADTGDPATISDTEITGCTTQGIQNNGSGSFVIRDSWIHDLTGNGVKMASGSAGTGSHATSLHMDHTVVSKCTLDGVLYSAYITVMSITKSVLYENTSNGLEDSTGVNINANTSDAQHMFSWILENNIIYGNGSAAGTYGVNVHGVGYPIAMNRNNAYGANHTADRNNLPAGSNDVTLSGDPFTNAAGGDFSLNGTAGAGAACKGTGYPQTFAAGLSTASAPSIGITEVASGSSSPATTGYTFSLVFLPLVAGLLGGLLRHRV